jgi:hypothetical protein
MAPPKSNTGDNSSFLETAMAGGGAYGTYRFYKSRKTTTSPSDVFSAHRQVVNAVSPSNASDYLEKNASFFRTEQGGEIARAAWTRATRSIEPNAENVFSFTDNLEKVSPTDVYSSIKQTIDRNNSIYMSKIINRFETNAKAFKTHADIFGGALPKFNAMKSSLDFGENISLNRIPKEIRKYVAKIQKELNVTAGAQLYSRPGWKEKGLGLYNFNFLGPIGNFDIKMPLSSGGVLTEGLTQSNTRIANDVMLFGKKNKFLDKMSRHEYYMRNITETILPAIKSGKLKTSFDIQAAVNELYQENIAAEEYIPNLPTGVKSQGWESYSKIRGQGVDIRFQDEETLKSAYIKSVFRKPTEEELTGVITSNKGLFPFASASNIAEGRLSTYDPRGWLVTPNAIEWSRKPSQVVSAWRPTPDAAKEMMKTPWAILETQQWRQDMGPNAAPWFKSLYINPEMHYDIMDELLGEGEIGLIKERARMKQVERINPPIALSASSISEGLEERIKSGGSFKVGEVLGMTTEGMPLTYEKGMKLLSLTPFETQGKGDYLSLAYKQTENVDIASKAFGHAKGMERLVDKWEFDRRVSRAGKNALFINNIERYITMDELKKDRSKHNLQMISGLWDVMRQRQGLTGKAQRFVANPVTFSRFMENKSLVNNQYSHENFVKNLMSFATQQGLSKEEFGSVFGAVPHVLGQDWAREQIQSLGLGQDYGLEMFRGFAGGASQSVFADKYPGTGGLASVEPRAFDILTGGQYGQLGNEIAEELKGRLFQSNPDTVSSHLALTKTLQSIEGKNKIGEEAIWDLSKQGYEREKFQKQFIEKGGGYLRTGKFGIPDVYVPGGEDIDRMTRYQASNEKAFRGDISNIFHQYASTANKVNTEQELKEALGTLTGEVGRHQAPIGKGAGSLLRGKIEGSRFLTGLSQVGDYKPPDVNTVGISESYAEKMFNDLLSTSTEKEEVLKMKERFMSGEKVGGVVARHPFIGEYSVAPMNLQVIKGVKAPVMALPSKTVELGFDNADNLNPVKLSPMVGMAGDLDADSYAAYLVSPKLSTKIKASGMRAEMSSGEDELIRQTKIQNDIRLQLIKAKTAKAAEDVSLSDIAKMSADARKLATAETWVPKLSVELTRAKQAIHGNLKAQEAANANFLLTWLEQVPIAGKHLSATDVSQGRMSSFFRTILGGFEAKDPTLISESVKGMLTKSDDLTKRLLTQDTKITYGLDELRKVAQVKNFSDTFKGIDIDETSKNITRALGNFEESGRDDLMKLAAGRKKLTLSNLSGYLGQLTNKSNGVVKNFMADVSTAKLASKNFLTSIGEGILRNKKKVGFGFAGALALSAFLSTPKDTIGSGNDLDLGKTNLNPGKAKDRMNPETMAPRSQQLGNPSIPPNLTTPSAHIYPGTEGTKVNIKANTQSGYDQTGLYGSINGVNRGNMNINIRNGNSPLSVHKLASKVI